ncbi:MAG: ACT domain-containing protein [Planctomycetes bacterium]|nr:ACT domain-containing protein [Planctomycetota bacterium]
MRVEREISVALVNEPGRLAQALAALAKAKVNIVAMTVTDSFYHGVLRLVVDDMEGARKAFEPLNLPTRETEVVCVDLANRPGAFASLAERLAADHVNIQYAYCTAGAPGGRTTGILRIDQMKKALAILGTTEVDKRKTDSIKEKRMRVRDHAQSW